MLTHKNHFKFGYNHEWFRCRQSLDDQWMVSYGAIERPVGDFRQECYATARLIRDLYDGPLVVLFSGGADSEIVLRSFVDQGIKVRVAICQFDNDLNIHDVSYAVVCCQQLGVSYHLVKLDIEWFLGGEYVKYAEATQVRSPELCSTMWLADQLDGVPILGSGECYLVKRLPVSYVDGVSEYPKTPWDMYERELIAAWYRHFLRQQRPAVPGFFQYTPEIMLSFLRDDKVVDLVNDRVPGKRSTVTSKLGIYQKYFPLIERKKYNGYEKLTERVIASRVELSRRMPQAGMFLTEYNDLVAMLEGRLDGPRGQQYTDVYPRHSTVSTVKSEGHIDETRQLDINDYEQAMQLIEERFSSVIEFDRVRPRISFDEEWLEAERPELLNRWRELLADAYLQGSTHKMFGSFRNGKLMSMVGMRLVFENAWVLSNLKARQVPLSQTGLRQTMQLLYQFAKDHGLIEYYCAVAKYRYSKFQTLMHRLVPEYYDEYEGEVLAEIAAGSQPANDFWWGMIGRYPNPVDIIIKRMRHVREL